MEYLNEIFHWLHQIIEQPLLEFGGTRLTMLVLLQFVLLVALVFLGETVLRRLLTQRVLNRTHLDEGMRFAVARIVGYIFICLGFYVALKLVGIDLSSLAVLAGAVGVGLGFGLQNIVSNFISGLIILAERPIAIGDRVEVNGVLGQVTQIKLRSTVVVTNDNISVIVPNSSFISDVVVNWSHGDSKVRMNLPFGVAYGSDIELMSRVIVEVAKENPHVLVNPPPKVFFIGFGDSSLDFELGVWTIEMARRPKPFRSELYFAIERTLRKHGIEIPFPQRDLHIRSGTLPVRRENAPRTDT